jgi:hypothetical protein
LRTGNSAREIAVGFVIVLAIAAAVCAAPQGPDTIEKIKSERMQPRAGAQVAAQAGNVTELNINATSVTKSWQGYYGNVSGTITLDDANNKSLYQWDLANPQGEIYASPSQISDWGAITCFNYSAHAPELNLSELEKSLNIRPTDVDGVNETFRYSFGGSFYVGTKQIDSSQGCMATYTYTGDQPQTTEFAEVLLTDSTNIIYTAILEQSASGFDSKPHDFQMLVGEDGHNGDVSTTQYYFYVELE